LDGVVSNDDAIEPDTKDWTWVLHRRCPDCGFDARAHPVGQLPVLVHDTTMEWADVLLRPDVARRPGPAVWSPLEYACHVRDVHRVFAERVTQMLEQDRPAFASWDQDETARAERYGEQDPATVAADLIEAGGAVAGLYATVTEASEHRSGLRSDGSEFTVETLGQYHLHDVVHHLWDVR
jgi:hypothetical protein